MPSQSFGDLGASRAVVKALADRGITAPVPGAAPRRPRRHGGPRRARQVAHRVRQDARLRRAAGRDDQARRPPAERARARSHAGAGRSRSRTTCSRSPRRRACPSRSSTAAPASSPRSRRRGAPTCWLRRPAASRTCSSGARCRSAPSGCSSSTRPTGCSTWASARPSTASSPSCRASARRCSSRPPSTARSAGSRDVYTTDARSHEHAPSGRAAAARCSTASSASSTRRSSTPWCRSCATTSAGLTLVFVRTKRGADRLVKRLGAHDVEALAMHGNKSQSQREKALARFESGPGRHARRHRCGGPRPRHRRHHARHQLRRSRRPRGLHPPGGPYRPGRPQGGWRDIRRTRAGKGRSPHRARSCAWRKNSQSPALRPRRSGAATILPEQSLPGPSGFGAREAGDN